MAGSVNKVILIGNVGRDPEMKATTGGTPLVTFSIATSYGAGDNRQTEWHKIVCWSKLAEFSEQYVRKGRKVYIEGRIQSRKYTGNDGVERVSFDIVANQIDLLDARPAEEAEPPTPTVAPRAAAARPVARPAARAAVARPPSDDDLLDGLGFDMDTPF